MSNDSITARRQLVAQAKQIYVDVQGRDERFVVRISRKEADSMFEPGDGRVTRDSVLAAHLPAAADSDWGSGVPEASQVFFGAADHHGIYAEPTFQSLLLRMLMRSHRVVPHRNKTSAAGI